MPTTHTTGPGVPRRAGAGTRPPGRPGRPSHPIRLAAARLVPLGGGHERAALAALAALLADGQDDHDHHDHEGGDAR